MSKDTTTLVEEGLWGKWKEEKKCKEGEYVLGLQVRFEKDGGDDDTALNGIKMRIGRLPGSKSAETIRDVEVEPGFWGEWRDWVLAPDGFYIAGMRTRFEKDQGNDGDDSALNGIEIICRSFSTDETERVWVEEGLWGDRGEDVMAPEGEGLVGLKIRMEEEGGDDTAMNGIKMITRPFPRFERKLETDPGLQLHFRFDELRDGAKGGEKVIPDSSGHNRHGQMTGSDPCEIVSDNRFGNCLALNSSDTEITAKLGAEWAKKRSFTVALWVMPIVDGGWFEVGPLSIEWYRSKATVLNHSDKLGEFDGFTKGEWHHIAISVDHEQPKIAVYIDQVPVLVDQEFDQIRLDPEFKILLSDPNAPDL